MTATSIPSLAGADWLALQETQAVFRALAIAGHEARAVGGVVRNTLLGIAVTDIDIATPATPDAIITACEAAGLATVATGLQHGTITVIANHLPFEVTTLRRDVETDGRRAIVAFTSDWAADAARRDFTMNALYCDASGRVHDPLGGYADVVARRVRFIGDPDARIGEDTLRILRFFRFHAALGEGAPDRAGLAACVRGRHGLARLSAERIRTELVKLLLAPRALDAVAAMSDWGLMTLVVGAAPRPGVLAAVAAAEAASGIRPDAMLRLSGLAVAVEEDIARLARRLKLSNADGDALLVIDRRLADAFAALDAPEARRALYRRGANAWRRQVLAAQAAGLGRDDAAALHRLPDRWPPPRLPIRGADILALGLPPGPEVGALLREIEAWWIAEDFPGEAHVRDRMTALAGRWKG